MRRMGIRLPYSPHRIRLSPCQPETNIWHPGISSASQRLDSVFRLQTRLSLRWKADGRAESMELSIRWKFHGGCTTDKGGYLRIPFFRCNQRYRSQDGRYYFPEVWASDTGNHGKQPAGTLEDPWNFREEAGCYCGVLWKNQVFRELMTFLAPFKVTPKK